MGDHAYNPEFYKTEEEDKTYFYLLVGMSIFMLVIAVVKLGGA